MSDGVYLPRIDLAEPLSLEYRHFLECIKNRAKPVTDGREGLRVVRLLERIEEAVKRTGGKS